MLFSDWSSDVCSSDLDRLERFSDRIISCRIAVEADHRLAHMATIGLKLEVSVPGNVIVAKRAERSHGTHDNNHVLAIIKETFDAAIRPNGRETCRERVCQYG